MKLRITSLLTGLLFFILIPVGSQTFTKAFLTGNGDRLPGVVRGTIETPDQGFLSYLDFRCKLVYDEQNRSGYRRNKMGIRPWL